MSETPNIDQWLDHPKVKELVVKMDQLQQTIANLRAQYEPMEEHKNKLVNERTAWAAQVQREMDRRNAEVLAAEGAIRQVRYDLNSADQLYNDLKRTLGASLEELELERRKGELEEQFTVMVNELDFVWAPAIREFQWRAAQLGTHAFIEGTGGFAIFDQMGLGKTLEAWATIEMIRAYIVRSAWSTHFPDDPQPEDVDLSLIGLEPADLSVLWICPNSIKTSTMKELQRWGCELAVKVEGSPEVRKYQAQIGFGNGAVVIANYETLHRTDGMLDYEFPIVVCDEAHQFRNENTKTFESVETLCKQADFVVPMTGTPLLNKPEDLWAILHMLTLNGKYEGRFENKYRFLNEYCWNFGGKYEFHGNAGDKLMKSMGDMVIRRRKDEVLKDLPDKEYIKHEVTMGEQQRDLYNQLRDKLFIWMDEQAGESLVMTNFLQQLTVFRQMALYPAGIHREKLDEETGEGLGIMVDVDCDEAAKLDRAVELITEMMANGEKVIVFATFNEPLKALQARLAGMTWDQEVLNDDMEWATVSRPVETAAIIGGVNEIKRSAIVDQFNDDDSNLRVVVGNIKAMGIGLNMQGACSNAIFLDKWWNPGINEQAEDRIHRNGQTKQVQIHVLHAEDSVDNFIQMINDQKAGMIEGTIERKELRRMIEDGLI